MHLRPPPPAPPTEEVRCKGRWLGAHLNDGASGWVTDLWPSTRFLASKNRPKMPSLWAHLGEKFVKSQKKSAKSAENFFRPFEGFQSPGGGGSETHWQIGFSHPKPFRTPPQKKQLPAQRIQQWLCVMITRRTAGGRGPGWAAAPALWPWGCRRLRVWPPPRLPLPPPPESKRNLLER